MLNKTQSSELTYKFKTRALWSCPRGQHIEGREGEISMETECKVDNAGNMFWSHVQSKTRCTGKRCVACFPFCAAD